MWESQYKPRKVAYSSQQLQLTQQFHHFWHVCKIVINYLFNLERSISLLCIIISDNRQLMYHCYLVMIQFSSIVYLTNKNMFQDISRIFKIIRLKKDGTSV